MTIKITIKMTIKITIKMTIKMTIKITMFSLLDRFPKNSTKKKQPIYKKLLSCIFAFWSYILLVGDSHCPGTFLLFGVIALWSATRTRSLPYQKQLALGLSPMVGDSHSGVSCGRRLALKMTL